MMNIQIKKLAKDYENNRILEIEELEIQKGSLLGIIGPNGAGKSTLIKLIGALERTTEGEIYYNGRPLQNNDFKNITVVFQKPYLLRTSVFNNVAYPLMIRKENKNVIESKVNSILEDMGLTEIKNQNSWTLSGGEAQKAALARALVFKPSLLILDEPTANIDPSSMAIMEKMIKKTNEKDSTTVIMVTHNIHQALRLCKEVLFMNKGKIIEKGSTQNVIYHPKNQITEKFIKGEIIL
jgi:tungstate transport system ATP-binding protein